jgi:glycosyltransferase involved in cell wall biosynthesis
MAASDSPTITVTFPESRSFMRVLHITAGLDPRAGGPVSTLEGLASALANVGLEIEIVAPWRRHVDWSVAERLEARGVTVTPVGPVVGPTDWHPALQRVLRQSVPQADVLHIHGLWEEIQHRAARLARQHQKPYIIRPHGMLDPWSLQQKALKKRLYMALRLRGARFTLPPSGNAPCLNR